MSGVYMIGAFLAVMLALNWFDFGRLDCVITDRENRLKRVEPASADVTEDDAERANGKGGHPRFATSV